MAFAVPLMMVATAVGAGITAYGQYQAGQAQKRYYNYMAKNALTEAGIAQMKSGRDIMAGEQMAQRYGIQTAQLRGGTTARAGAGNVTIPTGSTAGVLASQLATGQEEEATARQTAAERAYGEQVEAAAKVAGAGADVIAGQQAATAGEISAAGTIVSGAGSVAGKWYDVAQTSGPPPMYGGVNPDSPAGRVQYSSSIYGG